MSIPLVIQGTVIDYPSDSQDPDWAEGTIAFAEAVTIALSGAVGTFDVSPQTFDISAYNPTSVPVAIPNLAFSPSVVLSATITISCTRTTNSTTVSETSILNIVYNATNSTGMLWELTRQATANANITYTITDTGQLEFATTSISGTGYTASLSFAAKALQLPT